VDSSAEADAVSSCCSACQASAYACVARTDGAYYTITLRYARRRKLAPYWRSHLRRCLAFLSLVSAQPVAERGGLQGVAPRSARLHHLFLPSSIPDVAGSSGARRRRLQGAACGDAPAKRGHPCRLLYGTVHRLSSALCFAALPLCAACA